MYKDTARMKVYHEKGEFPSVTKNTGLESLKEVLQEDMEFPCGKSELIRKQRWKLIAQSHQKSQGCRDLSAST